MLKLCEDDSVWWRKSHYITLTDIFFLASSKTLIFVTLTLGPWRVRAANVWYLKFVCVLPKISDISFLLLNSILGIHLSFCSVIVVHLFWVISSFLIVFSSRCLRSEVRFLNILHGHIALTMSSEQSLHICQKTRPHS